MQSLFEQRFQGKPLRLHGAKEDYFSFLSGSKPSPLPGIPPAASLILKLNIKTSPQDFVQAASIDDFSAILACFSSLLPKKPRISSPNNSQLDTPSPSSTRQKHSSKALCSIHKHKGDLIKQNIILSSLHYAASIFCSLVDVEKDLLNFKSYLKSDSLLLHVLRRLKNLVYQNTQNVDQSLDSLVFSLNQDSQIASSDARLRLEAIFAYRFSRKKLYESCHIFKDSSKPPPILILQEAENFESSWKEASKITRLLDSSLNENLGWILDIDLFMDLKEFSDRGYKSLAVVAKLNDLDLDINS